MGSSEAARLYQAALEERRIVRARLGELIPSEALEAEEHIDGEVWRSHAVLMDSLYGS